MIRLSYMCIETMSVWYIVRPPIQLYVYIAPPLSHTYCR